MCTWDNREIWREKMERFIYFISCFVFKSIVKYWVYIRFFSPNIKFSEILIILVFQNGLKPLVVYLCNIKDKTSNIKQIMFVNIYLLFGRNESLSICNKTCCHSSNNNKTLYNVLREDALNIPKYNQKIWSVIVIKT